MFAREKNNMEKEEQIKKLKLDLIQCQQCALRGGCRAPVPGIGSYNATVFICGEAPGSDEDEKGEPFVGRCGQILRTVLNKFGYNKDNTYISNIVRCRPKDNKFPGDSDLVENCAKWVKREIEIIKPKIILTLGNQPLKYILGGYGITKVRGNMMKFNDIPAMPTYHPSYVMRKDQMKDIETRKNFEIDIETISKNFLVQNG